MQSHVMCLSNLVSCMQDTSFFSIRLHSAFHVGEIYGQPSNVNPEISLSRLNTIDLLKNVLLMLPYTSTYILQYAKNESFTSLIEFSAQRILCHPPPLQSNACIHEVMYDAEVVVYVWRGSG